MTKTTYLISVAVRDENGKILQSKAGIKVPTIQFEKSVKDYLQLEYEMSALCRQFQTLMPEYDINLEASLYNGIGDSWMYSVSTRL